MLHFPEMDHVKNVPDFLYPEGAPDNKTLSEVRSPIALFMLHTDGIIRISAIQRDPKFGIFRSLILKIFLKN